MESLSNEITSPRISMLALSSEIEKSKHYLDRSTGQVVTDEAAALPNGFKI